MASSADHADRAHADSAPEVEPDPRDIEPDEKDWTWVVSGADRLVP